MPNQERLRETKHHGAVRFPFNIYPCTIPGDFLQVPLHWHDGYCCLICIFSRRICC